MSKAMDNQNNDTENSSSMSIKEILEESYLRNILIAAILLILVVLTFYFVNFHSDFSIKNDDWGTFGDFFGGSLNPLLSFLSLFAVLITIKMQAKELKASNKALEKQADELKESNQVLNLQNDSIAQQTFKSMFFSLINISSELIKDLEVSIDSKDTKVKKGRAVFQFVYKEIKLIYKDNQTYGKYPDFSVILNNLANNENIDHGPLLSEDPFRQKVTHSVNDTLEKIHNAVHMKLKDGAFAVDHYLYHIEQIVLFIIKNTRSNDEQIDNIDEVESYLDLLKSQMSRYEMLLFFYHCLSCRSNTTERIYPALKKYDFFENIVSEELLDESHQHLFI